MEANSTEPDDIVKLHISMFVCWTLPYHHLKDYHSILVTEYLLRKMMPISGQLTISSGKTEAANTEAARPAY